jgi:DNA polymerase (family 10)
MAWTNEDVARQFAEIAALLKIRGEDAFRVRAYERAAAAIGASPRDLAELTPAQLTDVKGIGASTAKKITEYLSSGRIAMLEELRAEIHAGVMELTRVPGLGPKTAILLNQQLGIATVEDLRAALEAGRLRGLPGLGAKTEGNLREALGRLGNKDIGRLPVADVVALADELCDRLARLPQVLRVAAAGSLRRMRETVGDLDLLAAAHAAAPVMAAFREADLVDQVLVAGEKKTSVILRRGLQADLRVVEPEAWGAAMVYFTGS